MKAASKRKEYILTAALILAMLVILILLLQQCGQPEIIPGMTAVIEKAPEEELNDTSGGSIRIKLSPSVTVRNDTLQNLNFCNYNEERLMRCRILCGDVCIYESGYLEEGEILVGDLLNSDGKELLKSSDAGVQEALVEVYSFDMDRNQVGQTNVKIKLHVENSV